MHNTCRSAITRCTIVAALAATLSACAVAPPRNEDPWQGFNRKMFAFNQFADKVAIRPVAKGYVKITTPKAREHISDFFANLLSPVTIVNEVLQGRPGAAIASTGRFAVNTTIGVLGFFDPATRMRLPAHPTDFGVTLARWGVPQGPYLVLPFIGSSTVRDVWSWPVDSYLNPMVWYIRDNNLTWYAEYLPEGLYLVSKRASLLPFDHLLDSAFDPYAFMRDAYLQRRLYEIYYGNPPLSAIEELQGTAPSEENNEDIEQLLQQQQEYEKTHPAGTGAPPASPAPPSSVQPAPATTSAMSPARAAAPSAAGGSG